jgi:hypothetical protein
MKKTIVKNEYYEMSVDVKINRAYWVMRGLWKKISDIPDYRRHTREAMSLLKPGFTSVIDLSEFKTPSPEVLDLLMEVAKETEDSSQGRQAQIINKEDMEIVRTSRSVMKEADMDTRMMQFDSYEEAIEWLDR